MQEGRKCEAATLDMKIKAVFSGKETAEAAALVRGQEFEFAVL